MTSALTKKPRASSLGQPSRHFYDVAVLGTQAGGMLAGALLAKRGYQVIQLNPFGHAPHYEAAGVSYPMEPSLLPSLRTMPRVDLALYELGINLDVNRAVESGGHALQFLLPGHRFSHATEASRLEGELSREFPDRAELLLDGFRKTAEAADETQAFFGTPGAFPPRGFFDRFFLRKLLRQTPALSRDTDGLDALGDDAPIVALRALAGLSSAFEAPGSVGEARALSHLLRGAHRIPGGERGLGEILGQRLLDLGGDALGCEGRKNLLRQINLRGARIESLELADTNTPIHAKYVVAALDVEGLAPLLPEKKASKLKAFAAPIRPTHCRFVLNLLVKSEALPLGLDPLAIFFPASMDGRPMIVEVSPTRTGDGVQSPTSMLTAACRVPLSAVESPSCVEALAANVERALVEELCPFLDRNILARSVPLLAGKPEQELPAPCFTRPNKSFLGLAGLPPQGGFKNLYLANRQVLPGLGFEGELIAGVRVADLLQKLLHKHNPLK